MENDKVTTEKPVEGFTEQPYSWMKFALLAIGLLALNVANIYLWGSQTQAEESQQYSIGQFTASGLPSDSLEGGRESFLWLCANCHGDDGTVPAGAQGIVANSPERLLELTEADIRLRITEGGDEMPAFGVLFSPTAVDGLVKYLDTWTQ